MGLDFSNLQILNVRIHIRLNIRDNSNNNDYRTPIYINKVLKVH